MSITVHNVFAEERSDLPVAPFTMPGGEPHVNIGPIAVRDQYLWVDARVATAKDFMETLATVDALKGQGPKFLGLFLPYFPGARQDRRESGPFTLKLYADAINRLGADVVVTVDPHSDVLSALVERVQVIKPYTVMPAEVSEAPLSGWICPDAGAEKRVLDAARVLGIKTILHARKLRDPSTGKLSGFQCDTIPHPGRYVVVDDICDGGGTFIGLAKALTPANKDYTLDLWVSHGIFSHGLAGLQPYYDRIYTTDSFPSQVTDPALKRTDLHPFAAAAMRRAITR